MLSHRIKHEMYRNITSENDCQKRNVLHSNRWMVATAYKVKEK